MDSHPKKRAKDLNIGFRIPKTEDLVHHIRILEKNDEQKSETISDLKDRMTKLEARVGSLESKAAVAASG